MREEEDVLDHSLHAAPFFGGDEQCQPGAAGEADEGHRHQCPEGAFLRVQDSLADLEGQQRQQDEDRIRPGEDQRLECPGGHEGQPVDPGEEPEDHERKPENRVSHQLVAPHGRGLHGLKVSFGGHRLFQGSWGLESFPSLSVGDKSKHRQPLN